MSLNVYDFNKFDGIAETDNQGDYELRIYLKGNCNCETVILSKCEGVYNIYNFIVDEAHLKNMLELNWFAPITKITLYVEKVNRYLTKFINYALKNKVEVKLITKPF